MHFGCSNFSYLYCFIAKMKQVVVRISPVSLWFVGLIVVVFAPKDLIDTEVLGMWGFEVEFLQVKSLWSCHFFQIFAILALSWSHTAVTWIEWIITATYLLQVIITEKDSFSPSLFSHFKEVTVHHFTLLQTILRTTLSRVLPFSH